eukprot:TRINITY_DN11747_c0_g1_i2.p1 TRINITY_DN11747_c0_g1~~TRINITY_DN11747_c0_g1_i2.p1  ORF type:complete len:306 (-),score=37.25 TRINITY_DN11747_c0_g1_i2:302-1219(-)
MPPSPIPVSSNVEITIEETSGGNTMTPSEQDSVLSPKLRMGSLLSPLLQQRPEEEDSKKYLPDLLKGGLSAEHQHAPSSVEAIRARYLHHLSQKTSINYRYVPNLEPILNWNEKCEISALPISGLSSSALAKFMSPPWRCSSGSEKDLASPTYSPGQVLGLSTTSPGSTGRGFLKPGSIRSSIVNISAAALGAGALSLPRAIYYSGIVLGPLMMLVLAGLSIMSIKMIVRLVELSGKDSYEEIAKVVYGPWFALLVEVNMVIFCFGTAVAYMITVGQISHQVLDAIFGATVAEDSAWYPIPQSVR